MFKTLTYLLILTIFSGCISDKTNAITYHKIKKPSTHKSQNYKTKLLYKEYKKWANTPYRYGGTNFKGVDCSALVQHIYKDAFKTKIPRTTKYQIKTGQKVDKKLQKIGDIIFFKTSHKDRHCGIIIEDGKFLHSSSSHGVIISSINNPYWRTKYLQTRRILP